MIANSGAQIKNLNVLFFLLTQNTAERVCDVSAVVAVFLCLCLVLLIFLTLVTLSSFPFASSSSVMFVYSSHPAWMILTESKELRSLNCCLCQQRVKSTNKCSAEVHV